MTDPLIIEARNVVAALSDRRLDLADLLRRRDVQREALKLTRLQREQACIDGSAYFGYAAAKNEAERARVLALFVAEDGICRDALKDLASTEAATATAQAEVDNLLDRLRVVRLEGSLRFADALAAAGARTVPDALVAIAERVASELADLNTSVGVIAAGYAG